MADNSSQTGSDNIATDDVTTLNGGAQAAGTGKVQRVKPGFGPDGVHQDVSAQFPFPVTVDGRRAVSYRGRASTFRIPGRAGTTGQKLLSIHNATGSTIKVDVEKITVDLVATVVKAVTVLPPTIRLWKVTVLPSNGTALVKVSEDSALYPTSSGSVTVLGDASADGTNSTTALTATLPAGTIVTEEFAPRLITAAGYEMFDRTTFLEPDGEVVTLNALEGLVLFADYVLATQNPTTDMWVASVRWSEYTQAT